MRSPDRLLVAFLTGPILPYVVAGVTIAAALTVGLILVAATIRGEDTATRLKARAPGPVARRVRHILSLHVYTGGPRSYGRGEGRRAVKRRTDWESDATALWSSRPLGGSRSAGPSGSRWGPGYYHGPV